MSGFTKIENDILEDLAKRRFNGTQYRILLTVLRYTAGFQRDNHQMSLKFIAEATGIDKSRVKKDLNKLIEEKVIKVVQEASFNSTRIIALNENLSEWQTAYSVPIRPQGANSPTGNEMDYSTGGEMDHTTGGESDPQERKIKEISKEKDDQIVPERLYENFFGFPSATLRDDFKFWMEESQFQEPGPILCEMIQRVAKEQPRQPDKYLRKSVDTLLNLRIFTLEAVKEYNSKFDQKVSNKKKSVHDLPKKRPENWVEPEPITKDEYCRMKKLEEEMPF